MTVYVCVCVCVWLWVSVSLGIEGKKISKTNAECEVWHSAYTFPTCLFWEWKHSEGEN